MENEEVDENVISNITNETETDENVSVDNTIDTDEQIVVTASYDYYDTYQQQIIAYQEVIIENQETTIKYQETNLFVVCLILAYIFIKSILKV